MKFYLLWALILLAQNFAFTLVSRARNSKSLKYHVVCSLFSNGVWFTQQLILIDNIVAVIKTSDWQRAVFIGGFYTTFTVLGSISSHWLALRIERKHNL